jgi:hypothetical protein
LTCNKTGTIRSVIDHARAYDTGIRLHGHVYDLLLIARAYDLLLIAQAYDMLLIAYSNNDISFSTYQMHERNEISKLKYRYSNHP